MKILITGASGFLGKFLCKKLEEEDNELFKTNSKESDLTKENSLNLYKHIKFDQIYHLAAWTQAGDFCIYHPGEQWINNQKINTNVLTWWKNHQPQAKMIAMGTSCSYDPEMAHVEQNFLKGCPIDSLYAYAMTKRMLLIGLISLQKQYKLQYLYIVPSTLYGPQYHVDGRQMHFIFDIIRKIILGKEQNEKVVLWGDGMQRRELVHVEDFIKIMLRLVKTENNTVINIGAGKDYNIQQFAKKVSDIVNFDFNKINFDTKKYVGAKSKILVIEKLKFIIGDYKFIPLNKGFEETIKWFYQNKKLLLDRAPSL